MKNRLLPSLLLASALAHVAFGATDYVIRFERKATVGDHYRIVATGSDERTSVMHVDDKDLPTQGDRLAFELSAACETLAVNPRDGQKKARLVIEKLTATKAAQTSDLLPAGTVVTVERVGEGNTYQVGENPAPPLVAKALATLGVSMSRNTGADDDDIFGTKDRKRVGNAWPINSETAAADFSRSGMPAKAENVSGSVKLVEVVAPAGEPLLRVAATMTMRGVNPPLPPGLTVQSSEFTSTQGGLFPVDLGKRAQLEVSTVNLVVTATGVREGKPVTLTLTMKNSRETKYLSN